MSIDRPGLEQLGSSGATNGQVPVWDAASGTWKAGPVPASGVQGLVQGANVHINATDPLHPVVSAFVPLTTEIGGVPDLVWDSNNELVMTEAP